MFSATRHRARVRLDERLADLRPSNRYTPPPKGWARAIRDALGMTRVQFAARLGIKQQTADDLERSEAAESITLASLRRAAAVLDCDLVYALVPRTPLVEMVESRARKLAMSTLGRVAQTMALEGQGVDPRRSKQLVAEYVHDHIVEKDLWSDL